MVPTGGAHPGVTRMLIVRSTRCLSIYAAGMHRHVRSALLGAGLVGSGAASGLMLGLYMDYLWADDTTIAIGIIPRDGEAGDVTVNVVTDGRSGESTIYVAPPGGGRRGYVEYEGWFINADTGETLGDTVVPTGPNDQHKFQVVVQLDGQAEPLPIEQLVSLQVEAETGYYVPVRVEGGGQSVTPASVEPSRHVTATHFAPEVNPNATSPERARARSFPTSLPGAVVNGKSENSASRPVDARTPADSPGTTAAARTTLG